MIPSPPPRTNQRYHPQQTTHSNNLAEMARLHRLGRAYSHEGVIESSLGADIDIYYPDEDGKFLLLLFYLARLAVLCFWMTNFCDQY